MILPFSQLQKYISSHKTIQHLPRISSSCETVITLQHKPTRRMPGSTYSDSSSSRPRRRYDRERERERDYARDYDRDYRDHHPRRSSHRRRDRPHRRSPSPSVSSCSICPSTCCCSDATPPPTYDESQAVVLRRPLPSDHHPRHHQHTTVTRARNYYDDDGDVESVEEYTVHHPHEKSYPRGAYGGRSEYEARRRWEEEREEEERRRRKKKEKHQNVFLALSALVAAVVLCSN